MRHRVFTLFRRSDHDRTLVAVCFAVRYVAIFFLLNTLLKRIHIVSISLTGFTFIFRVNFEVRIVLADMLTF